MHFTRGTKRIGSEFADATAYSRSDPGPRIAAKADLSLGPFLSKDEHRVLGRANGQSKGESVNGEREG
jgi:hypothetical protein